MSKEVKTAGQPKDAKNVKASVHKRAPVRLWVRSKFLGFRRNRDNQHANQAILKLEGVNDAKSTKYYLGKRCVYIYKGIKSQQGTKFRTIWGRITRTHGGKGSVIARFSPNLPSRAMGATIRVMLYPYTI